MQFRKTWDLKFITIFAGLLLLFPAIALAQGGTGGLRGQVTDPSGASVAGAKVKVTPAGGKPTTAETGRDGLYEFKNLPPGKYAVDVTAKGFAPFEVLEVVVAAGAPQKLDVKLELAVQEQKVVVEGETPTVEVNPESNAGAIVMTEKDLDALSDDPDDLQNDLEALAGPSAGPNGGQIYIDGFTAGQLPPKSAIREIRINANPFSSEYDKLGYGRIEIFTKPGADLWHGEVNFQGNDSAFNSKNPFAVTEPGYESTLFNGSIGGPISKKASFFFTAQYRDINDVSVIHANDPADPEAASSSVATPRTRLNIGPRFDYQVTPNNTLNVRYQYYRDDESNLGLISGFALAPQGYEALSTEQTLQVSDTQVFGTNIVNETRFQFLHDPTVDTPVSTAPQVRVLGAFTGGGNFLGNVNDVQNHYEVQNYTQVLHKNHTLKFGLRFREVTDNNNANSGFNGLFTFPSLDVYTNTLTALMKLPAPAAVQVPGGQFYVNCVPATMGLCSSAGTQRTSASEFDAGPYIQDDWKVRTNLTLSAGLRLESQTGIGDHLDWAPRLALAWGIGRGKTPPKTVLRVGSGIFYDRFVESLILQAERFNGTAELENVVSSPCFALPSTSLTLSVAQCTPLLPASPPIPVTTLPTTYRIASNLHAPGLLQNAVVLERQLTRSANLSVTYLNSRGWDQLLTNNINTPVCAAYPDPCPARFHLAPGSGPFYPFGVAAGNMYEYQSEGILRQNQLIAQVNIRAGQRFTITGYYTLNYANSDISGGAASPSFPSNPYNLLQDYGRASFDIRHRVFLVGTFAFPHGVRLSPFMFVSSGVPYSTTLSQDLIGSSQFNQRPGIAPAGSCPATSKIIAIGSIVCTPLGDFDTSPKPGEAFVPIDSLTGPTHFSLNVRLSKTWGFGEVPERTNTSGGGGGGGGGGPRGGRGPGGPMGGMGMGGLGPVTNKRYNLTLSVMARNVFNYTNLNTPTAVLNPPTAPGGTASASSFFGMSNGLALGPFSTQAASRVLYLQLGFSF